MTRPCAAPAHFPYHHRTVEQVDRANERMRNKRRLQRQLDREQRADLKAV